MIFDANQSQGGKPEDERWLPPQGPVAFKWSDDGEELLLLHPGTSWPYEIDLDRVNTPLQLIGWLDHMLAKTWFDGLAARKLISMICDRRGWEYHGI